MKVKVAFLLELSEGWLGGVNYYRNLLKAVDQYGSGDIEVVVVVPKDTDESVLGSYSDNITIFKTNLFKKWRPSGFCRKAINKIFRKDYVMASYLRVHGIQIISHNQNGLYFPGIKTMSWIPDFQHKHCPEFFSADAIKGRDKNFLKLAKDSNIVILSSYDAEHDFADSFPKYRDKSEVLHFVPTLNLQNSVDAKVALSKYSLPKKFFFLPNQYWIHKNHKVVLQALKVLRDAGEDDILVVSTGNTTDYRAAGYFEEIKAFIKDNNLEENYKILGLIPYDDVQALAEQCHAYINPSLFEGWSTTVEEAKYRGKCIILSDLAVHREQNPKHGIFFDPNNPGELAEKMLQVWNAPRIEEDKENLIRLNESMKRKFAQRYEEIVMRAVKSS